MYFGGIICELYVRVVFVILYACMPARNEYCIRRRGCLETKKKTNHTIKRGLSEEDHSHFAKSIKKAMSLSPSGSSGFHSMEDLSIW